MVHARAQRTWKSQSPENPRQIRWELELIGEGCPTINNGLLVSRIETMFFELYHSYLILSRKKELL